MAKQFTTATTPTAEKIGKKRGRPTKEEPFNALIGIKCYKETQQLFRNAWRRAADIKENETGKAYTQAAFFEDMLNEYLKHHKELKRNSESDSL